MLMAITPSERESHPHSRSTGGRAEKWKKRRDKEAHECDRVDTRTNTHRHTHASRNDYGEYTLLVQEKVVAAGLLLLVELRRMLVDAWSVVGRIAAERHVERSQK